MRVEIIAAIVVILILATLGASYIVNSGNRLTSTVTSTSITTTTYTLIEPSTVTSLQTVPVTMSTTNAETFTVTSTLTLVTPVPITSLETANVSVGGSPDTIAVNPDTGRIYISGESNILTVIDATSYNIIANITLPASSDGAIAIDNETNTIFVLLQNGIAEINGSTNQIIRELPLAFGYRSMAYDSSTDTIYGSSLGSYLVGADAQTGAITANLSIGYGADILVNSQTNLIYAVGCNESGLACNSMVSIVNGTNAKLVNQTDLGSPYYATAALDGSSGLLYVSGDEELVELNSIGNVIYNSYPETCGPFISMTVSPTLGQIIMAPQNYDYILVYNEQFGNLINMYSLPSPAQYVAFNTSTNETYAIISDTLVAFHSIGSGYLNSNLIGVDGFCPLP
ncbi:MAG TPA: hypothetical protein VK503_02590 [Candidatus Bathyarchaeia archaeon]|nr:hypothetical protein [Candidatus Bathyarchaeia archaeon]